MANSSEKPPTLYCADLDTELGIPPCCSSCHEDGDDDYAGPNDEYYVCCARCQWLEKVGKT